MAVQASNSTKLVKFDKLHLEERLYAFCVLARELSLQGIPRRGGRQSQHHVMAVEVPQESSCPWHQLRLMPPARVIKRPESSARRSACS